MPEASPPSPRLPLRLRRFFFTVLPLLALLHAYIGWRLLPALPLGIVGTVIGGLVLSVSTLLIPAGMLARFLFVREDWADRISAVGSLLMGWFSSLLVFTLLRDLGLIFLASSSARTWTALAVPLLALVTTLCFSLAVGMLVSACCLEARRAMSAGRRSENG